MEDKYMTSVAELLNELAEMHEQKTKEYGGEQASFGETMMTILGKIEIKTASDYDRFFYILHLVNKIRRYSNAFKKGTHSPDSLDDISIYSQMLRRVDIIHFDGDKK